MPIVDTKTFALVMIIILSLLNGQTPKAFNEKQTSQPCGGEAIRLLMNF